MISPWPRSAPALASASGPTSAISPTAATATSSRSDVHGCPYSLPFWGGTADGQGGARGSPRGVACVSLPHPDGCAVFPPQEGREGRPSSSLSREFHAVGQRPRTVRRNLQPPQ